MWLTGVLACAAPTYPPAPIRPGDPALRVTGQRLVVDTQPWTAGEHHGQAFRVKLPRDAAIAVAPAEAPAALPAIVGDRPGEWAAINGGFYDPSGVPTGLVRAAGTEHHPLAPGGGSGVLLGRPGRARIVHRTEPLDAEDALQSVDRLLTRGDILVRQAASSHRDARAAVAIAEDAVWFVVTAADESITPTERGAKLHDTIGRGMTLAEMASYLKQACRAESALNLDGAVSAQMVVNVGVGFRVEGEAGTVNAVVGW